MNEMQHHPEMRGATAPAVRRPLASARYVTCLAILVIAALGMRFVASQFAAFFEKEGLPLQKPLQFLEVGKLAPEYSLALEQPKPLSEEMLENLGTHEYLSCYLVNNKLDPRDQNFLSTVFVSYYTGQPDMVPHAPEECQQAAGWTLTRSETHRMQMLDHKGNEVELPMKVLDFEPPGGGSNGTRTVIYFFYANGRYVTSRMGVQTATSNLRDRYAYYAKLELAFFSKRGQPADRELSVASAEKLLRKLMPVLWKDHFPDWDAATSGTVAPANET